MFATLIRKYSDTLEFTLRFLLILYEEVPCKKRNTKNEEPSTSMVLSSLVKATISKTLYRGS